jgi:hypothetical protein
MPRVVRASVERQAARYSFQILVSSSEGRRETLQLLFTVCNCTFSVHSLFIIRYRIISHFILHTSFLSRVGP